MKAALLLATILLLITVFPTQERGSLIAKRTPYDSILPIEYMGDDGELYVGCTAWAALVNGKTVWVTADHCVMDGDKPVKLFLKGKEQSVLRRDPAGDLAVITGPAVPGLGVSFMAPSVRDYIWATGYPHGSRRTHTTAGIFSQERDDDGKAVFNVAVASGMSGGPYFDKEDMVVGVIRAHECPIQVFSPIPLPIQVRPTGFCPVSKGATLSELRSFLFREE